MTVSIQPVNPNLSPRFIFAPRLSEEMEPVPAPKTLTEADFPNELVAAIGQARLAVMPQICVEEKGTGYFDDCFSLETMPRTGVKGTDQHGRVFVAFPLTNPKSIPRPILFVILQRYLGVMSFLHKDCGSIPTKDRRFLNSGCKMSEEKYAALKEVFAGTHPDLTVGLPSKPARDKKA